ncbi:hypothetical protein A7985_02025 [Pseudoalteromonas luteoviolacea]|uniref:4-oxalocrotonate tautomerase n=2 Tax=Pseudoalteromonas luteoviolacea TaxID=43657 RepID=A0A1C0TTW3_9GAMM|nr:hypothetical protein A7985_02025 [Pseudoalteromonas luteoviolacea]
MDLQASSSKQTTYKEIIEMPILTVTTNKTLLPAIKEKLAISLSALTQTYLEKRPELINVVIYENNGDWYSHSKPSEGFQFYLQIVITEGTNSESQKAAWLRHTWLLFEEIFINVNNLPNYISIEEQPAINWGYNGQSQASRLNKQGE